MRHALILAMLLSVSSTAALALDCPVPQPQVSADATPDVELFKQIVRCAKGEKYADGEDGMVRVEVSALQVGRPRPWTYQQDSGSGQEGTLVYPVRATYSVTTTYKTATEFEEGAVRILNFYVDSFGNWDIGSEEPVSPARARRVER